MVNQTVIILTDKEAFDIRELLLSLANAKYATVSQQNVLVKIVQQIND